MIIAGISTDIYNYYNVEKKIITKNIFDPITQEYKPEYVQYFYTKVGELRPSNAIGNSLDKYV